MEKIKILLVEPNASIAEVIIKNLERVFDAEVIFHQSAQVAVERIKSGEAFSLILVRNHTEQSSTAQAEPIAALILNAVYDLSLKTPLIVIGEFEHAFKQFALVSDRLRIEEINRLALKALNLKKEDFEHLKLPEFVAFPVKHFYLMTISPCDVYIKLVKKTGDEYVKRLNSGDSFTKEDLTKYESLGLSEFYILRNEYEDFMNGLFAQTLDNLKKSRTLEGGIEVLADSFIISADIMRDVGITPACLAMVDQSIHMMKNQIQKNDKLGLFLKKLLDNKMSYSYRHSYLICALSNTLLPRMEWCSGDQRNILLEKLCMVSFFHDIYLEDERFIKISDATELKKGGFTPREIDTINNHANKAALLVQSYPKLPQGVDQI
ncbi:MAG: hypothetical protein EHM20_14675, partial [Alphaproteobacteria bacterium]